MDILYIWIHIHLIKGFAKWYKHFLPILSKQWEFRLIFLTLSEII